MSPVRPVIEIDEERCDGCGLCIPSCHEGALEIREGKARVVADRLCDGLGACLGECPRGALRVVVREAPAFVPPAAASPARPPARGALAAAPGSAPGSEGGCPGGRVRVLRPLPGIAAPAVPIAAKAAASQSPLRHWPVQIRLVPPHATFLDGADLLVAADCVPVALPTFHSRLLPGRAVMIGCPKFDDLQEYSRRFAALFATADVRSITVAVMEVPCCQTLPLAVRQGLAASGRDVPMELLVVGVDGSGPERTVF